MIMNALEIKAEVKGKFEICVTRADGKKDNYKFENMLLNNFFKEATASLSYLAVGTDSVVNAEDTTINSLGHEVLSSPEHIVEFDTVNSKTIVTHTRTSVFAAGAIVGNMSCIGLANSSNLSSGTNLKIKSLIKDVDGQPTTITATQSDQITVKHYLIYTIDQHQDLGVINVGGTDHQLDYYSRGNSDSYFGNVISGFIPLVNNVSNINNIHIGTGKGNESPPYSIPGNVEIENSIKIPASAQNIFVSNVSLISRMTVSIAANVNLPNNASIGAIGVGSSLYAKSLITLTPPLPKDNTIAYSITFDLVLSRG